MASSSKELAIAPTKEANYANALIVLTEDNERVSVPLTAADNRLASQVRVAKLRKFVDNQIKIIEETGDPVKPMDIKAIVDSFAKAEDMGRFAYAELLTPEEGGEQPGDTVAQIAKKMMSGVAEGMATAQIKANSAAAEREKKILDLGKKPEKKVAPISAESGEEWS